MSDPDKAYKDWSLSHCNDCGFNKYGKNSNKGKKYRIEQIVSGVYITLCTYHAAFYWLNRFKWWINAKSGYRLEDYWPYKWWIR